MSDNPKKTFLQSLGKYVLGPEHSVPPVEPNPPAEPPATPSGTPPVEPPPAPPVEPPATPPVETPPPPPLAVPPKKKAKSDPLPPIEKGDIEPDPAPPEPPKPIAELLGYTPTRAEVRYLEDLRGAEAVDPKYAGYFDREIDRLKRVNAFASEWRVKNPEDDLTPDTPAYRQFLKSHPPAVDAEERQDIRDTVVAHRAAEKAVTRTREEFREKLREVDEIKAEPVVTRSEKAIEAAVLAALPEDDPLHSAAKAGGLDAVAEVPVDGQVVATAVNRGRTLVREFIHIRRGLKSIDANNEYHVFLANTIGHAARIFAEQGGAERIREGKRFVSPEEYSRLTPAAQRKHFTFTEGDVVEILTSQTSIGAMQALKATRDEWAAREAKLKPSAGKPPGEPPKPPVEPPKPQAPPPPSSPPLTPSVIGSPSPTPEKQVNPRMKKMLGLRD